MFILFYKNEILNFHGNRGKILRISTGFTSFNSLMSGCPDKGIGTRLSSYINIDNDIMYIKSCCHTI